MKKIFSIIALASAFAINALAQTAGVYTVGTLTGGTNVLAASETLAIGSTFAVSEFSTVGIQITAAASTTNATAVTFKFAHSLDGSTYETTPSSEIEFTPNGVTSVTKVSSINVPNTATLKLVSIVNPNANGYVTNIAVKFRVKAAKVLTR